MERNINSLINYSREQNVTQIFDQSHRLQERSRRTIETLTRRAEISNIVAHTKHAEGANSKGIYKKVL